MAISKKPDEQKNKNSMTDKIIAVYTRQGYPSGLVNQYSPNFANTNVNTLILSGPNGDNGEIVYNNRPYIIFNQSGTYVGDLQWPASLSSLKANTNITSIYFSLGNSAIRTLAGLSSASLANFMSWLKVNEITGIDIDAENWGQPGGLNPTDVPVLTVTLAAINAGLALTAAPYNQLAGWQQWQTFVLTNNGSISWFNVQCYAGGSANDPVQGWFTQFNPSVPIVAGFEAINSGTDSGQYSPSEAQTLLQGWQNETPKNSLSGAFVWDFGFIISGTYSVSAYADAIKTGLQGG